MNTLPMLPWYFYLLQLWIIMWSGIAMWRSARLQQRNWFVVFLIIHTGGILELVYLFYFAKKRLTIAEVKTWFRDMFFTKPK